MKQKIIWFILCAIPFLLFFLQYPIQHSLTGNLDTIANLAYYRELKYWIDCQFSDQIYTTFCYPIQHVWKYIGADFGIGIIHIFFNYLGFNDLWAHYFFFSILFSLNAFSLFMLIRLFFGSTIIAFFGALIFNFSHFTLANLENPNTLVFFFSFSSIYFLMKYYTTEGQPYKHLIYSILLGGIQIYFSPYNFLFHAIIISCFVIYFDYKRLISIRYILFASSYLIIIFPFIYIFILGSSIEESFNVVSQGNTVIALSLGLDDFFRVLPNHLYLKYDVMNGYPWLYKIKSAYVGFFFYALSFLGIFKFKIQHKKLYLSLVVIGILVALGPFVSYRFHKLCPSFMYPIYEYLGFVDILRIPLRAFFISILGYTFIICGVLHQLQSRYQFLIWILFLLIFIENVPLKMETYSQKNILQPQTDYIGQLKAEKTNVVLNLPSDLFSYKTDQREYYYMYWHHLYECNIINGSLGFIPEIRMNSNKILQENQVAGIRQLCKDYNVDCIVFHKDLIYTQEERKLLDDLFLDSENFEVIYQSGDKILFRSI